MVVRKASMQTAGAVRARDLNPPSLAEQLRDSLVLSEAHIVEVVNEVLAAQQAHKAELFRRRLKSSQAFGASVKRVVVDVGVVLTLAKTLEADDDFSDAAALMHDIDYSAHEGAVGVFAKAMVECDIASISKAEGEDAVFYDLLPADALERRLRLILAFMDQMMRAH